MAGNEDEMKDIFGSDDSDDDLDIEDEKPEETPVAGKTAKASAKASSAKALASSDDDSDDELEIDGSDDDSDDDTEARLSALTKKNPKKTAPRKKADRKLRNPTQPRKSRTKSKNPKDLPSVPKQRKAVGGMNDDDGQATAEDTAFISGSDEEEDSDIIRTKGGWGEDNDIEDTGGGSDRKWLDAYWGKGKGKKKTKTDAQCRNIAAAFKQEMDDSTDTDIEANKKGEPALAKLLMLDALRAQVKKRDLQEKLLEVGLLMSIKRWLEPLPDRSFPNSTLRMGIFEALDEITDPDRGGVAVSPDEVAESGIGRIVMFYKLKDKNPNLKNIAQRLIDRWARPALNIASQGRSGYKEMHDSKTTKGYSKLTVPRVKMVKNEAAPEIIAEKNIQQHLEDRARKAKIGEAGFEFMARFPMAGARNYSKNVMQDKKMGDVIEELENQGKDLATFLKERPGVRALNKTINKSTTNTRKRRTKAVANVIDSRSICD